MVSTICPSLSSCVGSIEAWTKQNPKLAIITTIVFAALGITATSAMIATLTHAAVIGLTASLCFAACCTLGYFLVRQVLTTLQSPGIENTSGAPPNIPLNDVAAQTNYRVRVMNDTLNHLKAGFYTSPDGSRHTLDLTAATQGATLFLNAGPLAQRPGNEPTRIIVKNQDCLYAAADLNSRGYSPIVLDMASDGHFGGGYLGGARAQEEDCCRRSGLCLAADTRHGLQRRNFYPLHRNSQSAGIYVPRVPVFRADYDKGYQYLNRPFDVAYGILAAHSSPPLDISSGRPRLRPAEATVTREKIRTFFEMARQKGHQSVVFGAFGCGAFRNPPDHIAEIAMDVITHEFAHCFKEVVIAVRDDHNTGHAHNPEGNFKPFARCALRAGGRAFDANGQELTSV
jgi:uncharacterized protein (TIGR02452 family)